jgi:hypothetical protein
MSCSAIVKKIKAEAGRRGLTVQSKEGYRSRDLYLISNGNRRVFVKCMSSRGSQHDIFAGISLDLYDFFKSNGCNNYLIMRDNTDNHDIAIPFQSVWNVMFLHTTDPNGRHVQHMDFNISRSPYYVLRNRKDKVAPLEKFVDKIDSVFETFN